MARNLPDDRHPALLYLAQLGPGSRRTMTEALGKMARILSSGTCDARTLPWHELRLEHTSALRAYLAARLAPATANKHLAALRGVLKQAWRQAQISAEDYHRAIDLPAVHGPARRETRTLSPDQLHSLVEACERDPSPSGARDAALLALLYGAGLRRSELAALDVSDYDRETGTLSVTGTASRSRCRFTANREGRFAMERWFARRGLGDGPLFNPINKGGRIEIRRLSEQAIYVACHKRAAEAGLDPVSPEDLRRSLPRPRPSRIRKSRPLAPLNAPQAVQTA